MNAPAPQVDLSNADPEAVAGELREAVLALRSRVGGLVVGQAGVVDGLLTGLLADGHVLLEGVPGLGKTLLVKAFGRALSLSAGRIQFTPDLMPADILGGRVLQDTPGGSQVVFEPGPIFRELVLADEINRANPRTQAALLEAMAERQVTLAGTTHSLGPPFFVLATQNPVEMEGTYPLPEAQADRFLMSITVPPPDRETLLQILDVQPGPGLLAIEPVLDRLSLLRCQAHVRGLPMARQVRETLVDLVVRTRPEHAPAAVRPYLRLGASPRGAQGLLAAARARAAMAGRLHATAEDVRALAASILRHRLLLSFAARAEGVTAEAVLDAVLAAG